MAPCSIPPTHPLPHVVNKAGPLPLTLQFMFPLDSSFPLWPSPLASPQIHPYIMTSNPLLPPTSSLFLTLPTLTAGGLTSASSYNGPYGLSYCYTPTTYCSTTSSIPTCTPTFVYDSTSGRLLRLLVATDDLDCRAGTG
jgi:hypothetical protein